MKLFFVFLLAVSLVGCGGADPTVPSLATGPNAQAPVVVPSPKPHEHPMATVEFQVGSYAFTATRWLEQRGNVFRVKSVIPADPSVSDSLRIVFTVPSVVTSPDERLMRVRYGCSDKRQGDIYFADGEVSDAGSDLVNGAPVLKATVGGLESIFNVCGPRPVAVAFELYERTLTHIEAYVVVYLQNSQTIGSQKGASK